MPLYEYECDACGRRFELIRRFSDPPVDVCTLCGKGPVNRLLSSPAIQFKGSGWYITDYAQKGKSEGASSDSKGDTAAASSTASSETSNSESKSESKSDAATTAAPVKAGGGAND